MKYSMVVGALVIMLQNYQVHKEVSPLETPVR
jgi:hypothetical protein